MKTLQLVQTFGHSKISKNHLKYPNKSYILMGFYGADVTFHDLVKHCYFFLETFYPLCFLIYKQVPSVS